MPPIDVFPSLATFRAILRSAKNVLHNVFYAKTPLFVVYAMQDSISVSIFVTLPVSNHSTETI